MQLLTATFKRNNKTIKRVYHGQRCNDGSVQVWGKDTPSDGYATWFDLGTYSPNTAGSFAVSCRDHLHRHAATIGRRGWHRIA